MGTFHCLFVHSWCFHSLVIHSVANVQASVILTSAHAPDEDDDDEKTGQSELSGDGPCEKWFDDAVGKES